MKPPLLLNFLTRSIILATAIALMGFACLAQTQTNAPPFAEKVGAAATEVTKGIQDTGQAALTEAETLWKRIDEKRLKNRTFDELVAWIIMGLLVGNLLFQIGKLNRVVAVLFGLVGAFIGGIVANVTQLNMGLGPVLIRYEELLCSFLGGLALLLIVIWFRRRKVAKAAPK
jgi:uncharacterized membrane protein YeaQ/YmgE (transglycosylase-associated protein family)